MTALTPAVQDAAYRLGWAMEASGTDWFDPAISTSIAHGIASFTPEAEAERVEAVREAGLEVPRISKEPSFGSISGPNDGLVLMNDTQGQVPDASMVAQWKDE